MRRYDTASIRRQRPALAVSAADRRRGKWVAIDVHVIADVDTLPRKCCDSLYQRRKSAGAQPSAQVSAASRLFKDGCRGRA